MSLKPTAPQMLAALGTLGLLSCGPTSRRELANIPQRQITFDDMCQLQSYFDQRSPTHPQPFRTHNEESVETENSEPDEHGHMRRVQMGEIGEIPTDDDEVKELGVLQIEGRHWRVLRVADPQRKRALPPAEEALRRGERYTVSARHNGIFAAARLLFHGLALVRGTRAARARSENQREKGNPCAKIEV